jgi:serine/threonine protein kinase
MAAPTTIEEFLDLVRKSGVVDEKRLDVYWEQLRAAAPLPADLGKLAGTFVRDGVLTQFQAEQLLQGKWRRFSIGKYKVLERIGSGGMGSVYLCEHKWMRRRVAVKVLPTARAEEPSALERFYREARAVAALDHPNIVRAYDIDQDDNLHFLVMEYIDGSSLQEIVKRHGVLDVSRAAHYIRQAAEGLNHAHQTAGLVHRDIKPGNILVDRQGVVKVLDMGLARFFHDEEEVLTKKYDENVLGTADYLAPEQALDSHAVDIRADIYSLGATFYFCLTGNTPFNEGTVAQKLIWHQTRQPKPIRSLRPEVSEALAAVIDKMMAKEPAQRYQSPAEFLDALAPFTREPIPPPPEKEMPRLSPAAMGNPNVSDSIPNGPKTPPPAAPLSGTKKWEAAPSKPTTPPPQASSARPKEFPPAPARRPDAATLITRSSAEIGAPAAPPKTTRVQPALASQAPLAETSPVNSANPLSWEILAPDTADVTAHLDTAPHTPPKPRVVADKKTRQRPIRRKPRVLAGIAGGVIILGLVIWWIIPSKKNIPPNASSPASRSAATWYVTKGNRASSFKTVQEAFNKAQEGDRIIVVDEQWEEALILDYKRTPRGLTLEGGDARVPVHWHCPAAVRDRLIAVNNVQGLRIKGFLFDGQGRVGDLIAVQGNCAGFALENSILQGFTRNGIAFSNCTGGAKDPVLLHRVRIAVPAQGESAVIFRVNPQLTPLYNQYHRITDCRFEGPAKNGAVHLAAPVLDLELQRNRFYNSGDGIIYVKAAPRNPVQLTLEHNTFSQESVALRFHGLPLADKDSWVVIRNNLFAKTGVLAEVDDQGDKHRVAEVMRIFQSISNIRDSDSKEGNLNLKAAHLSFTLPTNPADDATFLRYQKNDPLAKAGDNFQPVGVPPE